MLVLDPIIVLTMLNLLADHHHYHCGWDREVEGEDSVETGTPIERPGSLTQGN